MTDSHWMTLEEAGRAFGLTYEQLWDYIRGRIPGAGKLTVYRLAGSSEVRVREEDLVALLQPVTEEAELEELERMGPRSKMPGHLF